MISLSRKTRGPWPCAPQPLLELPDRLLCRRVGSLGFPAMDTQKRVCLTQVPARGPPPHPSKVGSEAPLPTACCPPYCPPEGSKASGGVWRAVPHLPQPGGQAQSQGSGPLCLSLSPLSRLGPVSPTSRTLPALVSRRRPPGLIPWCAPFCSGKPPRSSREFPGEPMAF